MLQICQQSWHKHGAESKAKSSIPSESTLCEQLCISYEQPQLSPSLRLLGMAKGTFQMQMWGEQEGELKLWDDVYSGL